MSDEQVIATSNSRDLPHSMTFEVSKAFLQAKESGMQDWSLPVQFRFVKRDDGRWDLVVRTPE